MHGERALTEGEGIGLPCHRTELCRRDGRRPSFWSMHPESEPFARHPSAVAHTCRSRRARPSSRPPKAPPRVRAKRRALTRASTVPAPVPAMANVELSELDLSEHDARSWPDQERPEVTLPRWTSRVQVPSPALEILTPCRGSSAVRGNLRKGDADRLHARDDRRQHQGQRGSFAAHRLVAQRRHQRRVAPRCGGSQHEDQD